MTRSDPFARGVDSRTDAHAPAAPSSDQDDGWLSNASGFGRRRRRSTPTRSRDTRQGHRDARFAQIPAVADGVAQLRSIADSFEHLYSTDLRYALSERAEWSCMASRELRSVAKEESLASVAFLKHAQLRKLVYTSIESVSRDAALLSFDHRQARLDGNRIAWPLEADQAPLPHWALGQEIEAIISRRYAALASHRERAEAEIETTYAHRPSRKRRRKGQNTDSVGVAAPPHLHSEASGRVYGASGDQAMEMKAVSEFIDPVLLSVQQQLRRAYEHLALQETSWSSSSAHARNLGQEQREAASFSGDRSSADVNAIPKPRASKTSKRPSDWRTVLGSLAQRSEATSTGSVRELAFDRALQASTERLQQIYGSDPLHLVKGRPFAAQHYVKAGDVMARLVMQEVAAAKADDSVYPQSGSSQVPDSLSPTPKGWALAKHVSEASLLDPSELLLDHAAAERMRPAPLEQHRETWPLPETRSGRVKQLRFWRGSDGQIGSSAGPLSLSRAPTPSKARSGRSDTSNRRADSRPSVSGSDSDVDSGTEQPSDEPSNAASSASSSLDERVRDRDKSPILSAPSAAVRPIEGSCDEVSRSG